MSGVMAVAGALLFIVLAAIFWDFIAGIVKALASGFAAFCALVVLLFVENVSFSFMAMLALFFACLAIFSLVFTLKYLFENRPSAV